MSQVKFLRGQSSNVKNANIDNDAFYLTTDNQQLLVAKEDKLVPVNADIIRGEGNNSIVGNDLSTNTAISENAVSFGSNNNAGLKGYYWSEIDFANKIITLATAHSGGTTLSSCNYNIGDHLNIVNDIKYDYCCTITAISGGKLTVDSLPFSSVVSGDTAIEAYTVSSSDNPSAGIVDLGMCAFTAGEVNNAANSYVFSAGKGNTNIGQYSFISGYNNKAGYGSFVAGKNNDWTGQNAVCFGENNKGTSNKGFAVGSNNNHGNNGYTFSLGSGNTLSSLHEWSIGTNNSLSGEYNLTFGVNNISKNRNVITVGSYNNVDSEGNARTDSAICIGNSNTISKKHTVGTGKSITLNHYAACSIGIGLTSSATYQTVMGSYNDTTGMREDIAIRVTGAGTTANSKKTVETLSKNGDLRLKGSLTLNANTSDEVKITGITSKVGQSYSVALSQKGAADNYYPINKVVSAPVADFAAKFDANGYLHSNDATTQSTIDYSAVATLSNLFRKFTVAFNGGEGVTCYLVFMSPYNSKLISGNLSSIVEACSTAYSVAYIKHTYDTSTSEEWEYRYHVESVTLNDFSRLVVRYYTKYPFASHDLVEDPSYMASDIKEVSVSPL